jgi:hypothetical protein
MFHCIPELALLCPLLRGKLLTIHEALKLSFDVLTLEVWLFMEAKIRHSSSEESETSNTGKC